jgi:hypothetical protein
MLQRAFDQRLHLLLARDVAGNDHGLALGPADRLGNLLADLRLTARDDNLGALRGHGLGDGAADTAARPRDNGHLTCEIECIAHGVRSRFAPKRELVAKQLVHA